MGAKNIYSRTLIERNENPHHYEPIMCQAKNCDSKENLTRHRYNESIICQCCLNDLLEEASKEKEKENEEDEFEREGYYTDYTYNQLCEERNR